MTIDELIGKKLKYSDYFEIKKATDITDKQPYYISDRDGYVATITKVSKTHLHWITCILAKRVCGKIPFVDIEFINQ